MLALFQNYLNYLVFSSRPMSASVLANPLVQSTIPWNSTMSATLFPICVSAICHTSLTCLIKLVLIMCILTATRSLSRLFVATPLLTKRLLSKLCSIIIYMLIKCLLYQFLCSIRNGVCIPYQIHLVNNLKKHVVDVRRCLLVISLTRCWRKLIWKRGVALFPRPPFRQLHLPPVGW